MQSGRRGKKLKKWSQNTIPNFKFKTPSKKVSQNSDLASPRFHSQRPVAVRVPATAERLRRVKKEDNRKSSLPDETSKLQKKRISVAVLSSDTCSDDMVSRLSPKKEADFGSFRIAQIKATLKREERPLKSLTHRNLIEKKKL